MPCWGNEELIDSYDGIVNVDTVINQQHPSATTFSSYGQSFRPSSSYRLTRVRFAVRRTSFSAVPDGVWKAYLYVHSGNFGVDGLPVGSPLAESAGISHNSLASGAYTFREYIFDGTFILQANTPYYIVIYSLDVPFDANVWARIAASTLLGHEGTGTYYRNSAWSSPSSRDVFFYVYGRKPSCGGCTNQIDCEDGGCYWYNGSCHSSLPAPEQINNQSDCERYNHVWCGFCRGDYNGKYCPLCRNSANRLDGDNRCPEHGIIQSTDFLDYGTCDICGASLDMHGQCVHVTEHPEAMGKQL